MPILAFHNCSPGFLNGLNNYSPNRFENLLVSIQSNNYKFVGLSDYIDDGQKYNDVVLTFDDGYESFYQFVYPILNKLSIPATVFIPTDFIGKTNQWDYMGALFPSEHLSVGQIKELSKNGITIASHGLAHRCLTQMPNRLLNLELKRSKEILEDIIERKISFISYPFGRFNAKVESIASQVGYRNGLALSLRKRGEGGFTIPRQAVYAFDTPYSVNNKLIKGGINKIETLKGIIMNSYAGGTIFLNNLRGKK
ncbi:MAG: polysaccharide deacetylase family protein [candidate division Zixibacteria bacterium]|nr:polysaccharide deacetylase family protein [candidate division Zixibacteria bacterium]